MATPMYQRVDYAIRREYGTRFRAVFLTDLIFRTACVMILIIKEADA